MYLNLDNQTFYPDQIQLTESTSKGALLRMIPNIEYNQTLVACSKHWFEEADAAWICRRLTGVINRGEVIWPRK